MLYQKTALYLAIKQAARLCWHVVFYDLWFYKKWFAHICYMPCNPPQIKLNANTMLYCITLHDITWHGIKLHCIVYLFVWSELLFSSVVAYTNPYDKRNHTTLNCLKLDSIHCIWVNCQTSPRGTFSGKSAKVLKKRWFEVRLKFFFLVDKQMSIYPLERRSEIHQNSCGNDWGQEQPPLTRQLAIPWVSFH